MTIADIKKTMETKMDQSIDALKNNDRFQFFLNVGLLN